MTSFAWRRALPPLSALLLAVLIALATPVAVAAADETAVVRVACVGDSITYGAGVAEREKNNYPAVLGRLLGEGYEVKNFGVSGATLLKKGDKPYWKEGAFKSATAFNPDIVIIKLGTNDTKPQNWKHQEEFGADLRAMVDHFASLSAKPVVWLCKPVPAFKTQWGINDEGVREGVIPIVQQVAEEKGLGVIDLYTPMKDKAEWFPDNIHPNAQGAAAMAKLIHAALTAKAGGETSAGSASAPALPEGYKLVYEQDFTDPASIKAFAFTDMKAWRLGTEKSDAGERGYLELHGASKYKPPVRSPLNIALIATHQFGSFVLEADMKQTGKDYGHRDMCLFYGYQDPAHFYYTHIATKTDPHAHNIFIVNNEPRTKISTKTTEGFDWGKDAWQHVRLVRDIDSGKIEVYVNDMATPIMTAEDKTFGVGHLGFGSFDDTGRVSRVRIWAKEANAVEGEEKLFAPQ